MAKVPSFMPQTREFSQADSRVVQRPEGLDSLGTNPVTPRDVENGTRERYADLQVSPGSWWEEFLPTNASITLGGQIILCDSPLGFPAHSVMVDNWTNQYIRIDGVRRTIGPYSYGWVLNNMSGVQTAKVELRSPSPSIAQLAVVAGEYVWIGFAEAVLQPATGIAVAGIAGTPGSLTNPVVVQNEPPGGNAWGQQITGSATGAASAIAPSLPANAGNYTWITGFEVTGAGATAASIIVVTVTGTITGTLSYDVVIPAGATTTITPLLVEFATPIRSSAANTAITVNVPSFGAGNTNSAAVVHGFYSL